MGIKISGAIHGMGALAACASVPVPYRVVETPWAEALGAHRAVVTVEEAAEVVHVHLPWRRRDNPADKRIMVISASGQPVPHVMRLKVSPESADLLFGPVTEPGRHFIYYLPFHVQAGSGYYSYPQCYLAPEEAPPADWTERNRVAIGMDPAQREDIPSATVLAFESRTAFDSFYPMEVPMTPDEQKQFVAAQAAPWLVFPENRRFPIRMPDRLPVRWSDGPQKSFSGEAMRNEYYTFQLGVFAARQPLEDVRVEPGDLTSIIPLSPTMR